MLKNFVVKYEEVRKIKWILLSVEAGINVEVGKFYEINKRGGGIFFCGGWNFSKSVSVDPTFIREMRVTAP